MLSAGSYGGNTGRAAVRPRLVVLSHFSSREVEVQSCLYESDSMYAIIPRVPGTPIGRRVPTLSRRQNSASSAVDSTLLQSRGQVDRSKELLWRAYIALRNLVHLRSGLTDWLTRGFKRVNGRTVREATRTL